MRGRGRFSVACLAMRSRVRTASGWKNSLGYAGACNIRMLKCARVYVCLRRALVGADWNEGWIEIVCSGCEPNSNGGITI